MHIISSRRTLLFSFPILATLASGCASSAEENVHAAVNVASVGSALSASGITAINGVYSATCDGHASDEAWSAGVNGNAALANPELSVRKNDSDCSLSLTEIVVGATTYAAGQDIVLATSYAASPASFKDVDVDPVDFYGNAKISSLSFADDFTITLLVSSDPNAAETGSKQGSFATQTGTVTAGNVEAPTYTIALSSFTMQTDANDVVSSTSGYAQLSAGPVEGQTYAVYDGLLTAASTPEEIAAAYDGATYSGLLSSLTSLQIPHDQFALVGQDLTDADVVRTVIIRNTDAETGIVSYQLIAVTFTKA